MKCIGPFYLMIIIAIAFPNIICAQLTTPAIGGNKKASVSEYIGLTHITLNYDRPGVKKRDGQIWGKLIPVGFVDLKFGSSKSSPWRAGSNENTTFECTTDVMVEGKLLPTGKYGLFIAYDPDISTVIFSKNATSWGSYFYDPAEDALRVNVKPVANDKSVEWLRFEFEDQTPSSATVQLQWEKLIIPFKVEVDLHKTQIESFRKELRNRLGFQYQTWLQAAQYCDVNKINLEEGLLWIDTAMSFGGNKFFPVWHTKANILYDLGRTSEADAVMKAALPLAEMNDLHQYARQLLAQKKNQQAFEIFKMNYDKHHNEFTTIIGMARGYSGIGDFKKALGFAKRSFPLAPDNANKKVVEDAIKTLSEGKDIN